MEVKKSSFKEQSKDFKREFDKPQFYFCEVTNKEEDKVIGALPFLTFSKVDTMVIFNALAKQLSIPPEKISFYCMEKSNALFSAEGESDKYKIKLSLQSIKKKEEENKEEKEEKDKE